jgi:hypothetical protein
MEDDAARSSDLRAEEAPASGDDTSDPVSRRLAALRHDIDLAMADLDETIRRARAAREGEPGDEGEVRAP